MRPTLRDRLALATAVLAVAGACAPRPPLARAVRAPGGPVGTVVVEAEARVHREFPGTWRWRRAFASPGRYGWSVVTTGEPLHYLFDGAVVRAFVGGALTAEDASPAAPLRSQARFVAVALLDVLAAPGVRVERLAPDALPAGVADGLTVVHPDGGERYTVLLDARGLPVRVAGPIDLAPVGRGRLVAHQDDFRPVAGRLLPHRVVYELDGAPLAEERMRAVCAWDAAAPAGAFAHPARLPACDAR